LSNFRVITMSYISLNYSPTLKANVGLNHNDKGTNGKNKFYFRHQITLP
jgi:hypothetical protein